jgi:hypothetical protein
MPSITLPREFAPLVRELATEAPAIVAVRRAIRRRERFSPLLPLQLYHLAQALGASLRPVTLARLLLCGFVSWQLPRRIVVATTAVLIAAGRSVWQNRGTIYRDRGLLVFTADEPPADPPWLAHMPRPMRSGPLPEPATPGPSDPMPGPFLPLQPTRPAPAVPFDATVTRGR